MEHEVNAGYTITDRIPVGDYEYVIGERENNPTRFVTWKCKKDEKDYYWGHYLKNRESALRDLCIRILEDISPTDCTDKEVIIEVSGGLATIAQCPYDVKVSIRDFDIEWADDSGNGYVERGNVE